MSHAFHVFEPNLKPLVFSDKIKVKHILIPLFTILWYIYQTITSRLQFIKPAIRQTMYIFKQPFIGTKDKYDL